MTKGFERDNTLLLLRTTTGTINVSEYHIAQLNIAKMKFSLDSEEMSGFVDRLEDINALADGTPGFVWRLQAEDDPA